MLRRVDDLNFHLPPEGEVHPLARQLEADGHAIRRQVFLPEEILALRDQMLDVYDSVPPEMRSSAITPQVGAMYRYQMHNRSALCQSAMAHPSILEVIEPLLGSDCHVIACTAWRNPPGPAITPHGLQWHVDGGPFVPRADGTEWPEHIPYPVFVIGVHIYLQDVALDDGPTACIPGSHTSGLVPPGHQIWNLDLSYRGRGPVQHIVQAGDVDFRVSDVWHRRWPPTPNARGRFFLQINYGRRDIAQRVLPTMLTNHATPSSIARALTARERCLLGLHPESFFDA